MVGDSLRALRVEVAAAAAALGREGTDGLGWVAYQCRAAVLVD